MPAPAGCCWRSSPGQPSAHCWSGPPFHRNLATGMAMIAVSMAGLALGGGHALFFLFLLFGTGLGLAMTANSVLTGDRYRERRAAMLTLLNFSWSAGAAVSPFAVQFVIHRAGVLGLFWCMAAAGACSTLLALCLGAERTAGTQEVAQQASAATVQSSKRVVDVLRHLRVAVLRNRGCAGWLGTHLCPPAPFPHLCGASPGGLLLLAFAARWPCRCACCAAASSRRGASRRCSDLCLRGCGGVAHIALPCRRSCFCGRGRLQHGSDLPHLRLHLHVLDQESCANPLDVRGRRPGERHPALGHRPARRTHRVASYRAVGATSGSGSHAGHDAVAGRRHGSFPQHISSGGRAPSSAVLDCLPTL